MSFQLVGLPFEPFAPLFSLPEQALSDLNARRVTATAKPGFPCRVSLVDAEIGEELILLPYSHQPASSPYRSSGPIFVRKAAQQCKLDPGVVPDYVGLRQMSVRAYDSAHMMTDATVCEGKDVAATLRGMFDDSKVSYIHLHNAKRGCFSCRVDRV
ncbi:MAG TPA: DUF1203 domain-containing protein [Steroidobacteraceae bacterium]|nr:DUF1203 domain-containing protein [Steroidobacteraceae bacterium]